MTDVWCWFMLKAFIHIFLLYPHFEAYSLPLLCFKRANNIFLAIFTKMVYWLIIHLIIERVKSIYSFFEKSKPSSDAKYVFICNISMVKLILEVNFQGEISLKRQRQHFEKNSLKLNAEKFSYLHLYALIIISDDCLDDFLHAQWSVKPERKNSFFIKMQEEKIIESSTEF